MRDRITGYWTLSWIGLIANIIALPVIALIISYGPPLKVANMTLAISLGWPSAIVGIVSSSALLAERKWGVTLTIDSEINARVTPHFLSANKAEDETIPTIAAGHPRLIAKVIFATFKGGP